VTGLPIVTVDFPGDGGYYHTSNARIKNTLGFEAQWTMDRMLEEAAAARRQRLAKETR
jgi:UDP-glucose 4-epimerase